ncbi:transglutaminaseTgpA domain-containing protein [Nocardioides sp. Bht2]|uniref:transglutaminase family protein n=1 Tax=Nocardioides sp. Bht2 TaxID=3392297 RepID=UPI0039B4D9FA
MSLNLNRTAQLPLLIVTALTSWLTFLSWNGFTDQPSDFLMPLAVGLPIVSLAGALARVARFPLMLVMGSQLLAIFLILNVGWGSAPLPTPSSIRTVVERLDTAFGDIAEFASPVPSNEAQIAIALVLFALLTHLLVDLFACTLGRPPLAGLPLLAAYTVPVSVLESGVPATVFILGAAGFLLMLVVHEASRANRWGRALGASVDTMPTTLYPARRHPVALGSLAILAAVSLPLIIPTAGVDLLGGRGGNDNQVTITNPITDLRRDLVRKAEVPLLEVRGTNAPSYYRIAALTRYTGATWTPGDRDLPAENAADGELPSPTGLDAATPSSSTRMELRATKEFASLWLPTPLRTQSLSAGDDWRYDAKVLDIHSADNDITTAEFAYSLEQLEVDITAEQLDEAPPAPGDLVRTYATVPGDLPQIVRDLADAVTEDETTAYRKAVALQQWFRDPANFTYSLHPDDKSFGSGNLALEHFLSPDGRVGYCEQFASAMAIMARSLGIPARVSVGFLSADNLSTNNWVFTSHDLHAWPELYFEDAGWVAFEPTPASRATAVPEYTEFEVAPPRNTPSAEPSSSASAQPNQPSRAPTAAPRDPAPVESTKAPTQDERNRAWWLLVPAILVLLAGAALAPRWLRSRRRERRWAAADAGSPAEAAWAELRDTVIDVGREWPEGTSPRVTGAYLRSWLGAVGNTSARPGTGPQVAPEAAAALAEIVGMVERSRYASTADQTDAATVRALTDEVSAALIAGVAPRMRRRAHWFPRSVLRRTAAKGGVTEPAMDEESAEDRNDHLLT